MSDCESVDLWNKLWKPRYCTGEDVCCNEHGSVKPQWQACRLSPVCVRLLLNCRCCGNKPESQGVCGLGITTSVIHCGENKKHIFLISTFCVCVCDFMVVRSCLVSCNSPKRSPVFSLVCKVRVQWAWQPHPYIFIYSLPFSVSQAAAASWASGHTRPQPPSHIEHHPPSPKSLQLFFYTVTYSRSTGSALATHPPTPPWKVPGMHDKGAHTPFVHPLTASPV